MQLAQYIFWRVEAEAFVANRDGFTPSAHLNKDVLGNWYNRRSETILDDHLFQLWSTGRIAFQEMMKRSQQPEMLQQKVREHNEGQKRRKR